MNGQELMIDLSFRGADTASFLGAPSAKHKSSARFDNLGLQLRIQKIFKKIMDKGLSLTDKPISFQNLIIPPVAMKRRLPSGRTRRIAHHS